MLRDDGLIIVESGSAKLDQAIIRSVRGSLLARMDLRFFSVGILSIVLHVVMVVLMSRVQTSSPETMVIEKVPERFAKLIIDKPLPKKTQIKKTETVKEKSSQIKDVVAEKTKGTKEITSDQRAKVHKNVAARTARVEQKIRTVGVLGMLTGVGSTAKGPAVVDVLKSMKNKKERFSDLDAALEKMSGLKKTKKMDVLNTKLVKSKDLTISHKEEIDDLIAQVGNAKTVRLAKKGNFVIQKPQSIEGAASSNAKRDTDAINSIVSSHRVSVRMSYEKYLRRDPNLSGKVTVRFTISASGSVTAITILENTTGSIELEKEIKRKIRMWRFEQIPEGDVSVTYPFVFTSSN